MKLKYFTDQIVNELNASPLGGEYLFKNQGTGQLWVGKWGKHGIKFTEFKIEITRNYGKEK